MIVEGGVLGAKKIGMAVSLDLANPKVQEFLSRYTFHFGKTITNTTFDKLTGTLTEGQVDRHADGRTQRGRRYPQVDEAGGRATAVQAAGGDAGALLGDDSADRIQPGAERGHGGSLARKRTSRSEGVVGEPGLLRFLRGDGRGKPPTG
jgi:hypothetical protein